MALEPPPGPDLAARAKVYVSHFFVVLSKFRDFVVLRGSFIGGPLIRVCWACLYLWADTNTRERYSTRGAREARTGQLVETRAKRVLRRPLVDPYFLTV